MSTSQPILKAAGIAGDGKGPLFRTVRGRSQLLQRLRLRKDNAWHMVQRRAKRAGIATHISNHTFRATGKRWSSCLDSFYP